MTMSEFIASRYENTPVGLRGRLDDMCLDYSAYVMPSPLDTITTWLLLQAVKGERLVVNNVQAGVRPAGHFSRDLSL